MIIEDTLYIVILMENYQMNKSITIVLCTYNEVNYIEETL